MIVPRRKSLKIELGWFAFSPLNHFQSVLAEKREDIINTVRKKPKMKVCKVNVHYDKERLREIEKKNCFVSIKTGLMNFL